MKTQIIAAALLAVAAGSANAADAAKAQTLMKGSDCMACHAEATKLVGPSYKDIGKKYHGDAGAVDKLVKKVKAGGSGAWGAIPMTPHPALKDEDVKVGDSVISSGIGGVFPKGLPIGEVTMVKKGEYGVFQTIEVRPTVNIGKLEEMLVLVRQGDE